MSPGNKAALAFARKQKKIPAALKEVSDALSPRRYGTSGGIRLKHKHDEILFQVSANTDSSMSGYLQRSKASKKNWKRLWFVIKGKVLYTYAASEVSSHARQLL